MTNRGRCMLLLAASALLPAACERETRGFRPIAPSSTIVQWTRLTDFQPGAGQPVETSVENEYEDNAFAMMRGKQLYAQFNCVGCHAHGGGEIGPALMDDQWIYGEQPGQIFKTIVEGRPNGMPSFGGRIPENEIWSLVAYVRSMSGLAAPDAAPGREDDMKSTPPEQSVDKLTPVDSTKPPSVEMPQ